MAGKKKLLFVLNPISGGKSKKRVPSFINTYLDHSKFDFDIYWWRQIDDLPRIIQLFKDQNGYAVVAVGGDGTINAIASNLIHSSVKLACIPQGSGNGFTRELGISRNIRKAIQLLNKANEKTVDAGIMNDKIFMNVAGLGFDAKVSNTFSKLTKRGLWSYITAIYADFGGAKNLNFEVRGDDQNFNKTGFMLSIANGRQWGNNFFVAPKASLTDGMLDIVFLRKPKLYQIPYLVICLYFKLPNRLITSKQVRTVTIKSDGPCDTHVDGEPGEQVSKIVARVLPNALIVLGG